MSAHSETGADQSSTAEPDLRIAAARRCRIRETLRPEQSGVRPGRTGRARFSAFSTQYGEISTRGRLLRGETRGTVRKQAENILEVRNGEELLRSGLLGTVATVQPDREVAPVTNSTRELDGVSWDPEVSLQVLP